MKKTKLIFFILLSLSIPFSLTAQEKISTDREFDSGVLAYENGDYKTTVSKLGKLLDDLKLTSIDKIIRAHSLLGASNTFLGEEEKAKSHFKAILNFSPDYELSVNYFPPRVIKLFNEVKGVKGQDVKAPVSLGGETQRMLQVSPAKSELAKNRFLNSFIPFGVGQFKNNDPTKGYFFLTSEIITLASAITTLSIFKGIQNSDGTFDSLGVGQGLKSGFYASITMFGVIALTGVTDAIIGFKDQPPEKKKISLLITPLQNSSYAFLINIRGF